MAYKTKNFNKHKRDLGIIISPNNRERFCISPSLNRELKMKSPLTIISTRSKNDSPYFFSPKNSTSDHPKARESPNSFCFPTLKSPNDNIGLNIDEKTKLNQSVAETFFYCLASTTSDDKFYRSNSFSPIN